MTGETIMKGKKLPLALAAAAFYALLLVLLTAAEKNAPDANIVSIPLALWYSLTTLTTVGYGDYYPVTVAGRILGAVFQLMSVGILAVLIGAFVSMLRGRSLPLAKLRLSRKKEWFVFPETSSEMVPAVLALAASLFAGDPKRVIVFCGEAGKKAEALAGTPFIPSPVGPAALARLKGDGRISVFCMDGSGAENERLARELEKEACEVYCMTEHEPDQIPKRHHFFDPFDCCARLYWRRFPLRSEGETVVLIGDGKYAEAILACGLELNVTESEKPTQYAVFGSCDNFLRNHQQLSAFLSVGVPDPHRDSLLVSDQPWNSDPALLSSATRIVFCADCEGDTLEKLTELKRFFPVSCPVHAKLSLPFDDVSCFGSVKELFSPELVIRARLNETAIRLNEIYRSSVPGNAPAWEELSSFARRSNIASAEHLRVKARILLGEELGGEQPLTAEVCKRAYAVFESADADQRERCRRIEHARWMRFHFMNNWRYAEKRNNAARLHPLLLPYEQLSPEDQAKDDFAWELLKSLSDS
jgi:hypothetical protein